LKNRELPTKKSITNSILVSAILLFLSFNSAAINSIKKGTTVHLKGIVFDSDTNHSLPNVSVVLLDTNENVLSETISNSVGEYQFELECSTTYLIRTSMNLYNQYETTLKTNDQVEYINEVSIPLKQLEIEPLSLSAGDEVKTTGVSEKKIELVSRQVISENNPQKQIESNPIEINIGDDLAKTLQLRPIKYNLDDFSITPDTEQELQKIITILNENPALKIEVRSHTDSRSSFWYNKQLSVKRMNATIKYLVEEGGIKWQRIRGKAYGERKLINHCIDDVPCSEEEHQENRRSEFIVFN